MAVDKALILAREIVQEFRWAIDGCNITTIPEVVKRLLISKAWMRRYEYRRPIEFKRFAEFITKPVPDGGCGWKPDYVEALISKSEDIEALAMWREAMTAPVGTNQYSFEGNDNIMTLKTKQGTSLAYTVARLKRERPDLYERVERKELSANAAARLAGWRKQPTAVQQFEKIWAKLTPDEKLSILNRYCPLREQ